MLLLHVVNLWCGAIETTFPEAPPTPLLWVQRFPLICLYSNKPSFEIQMIPRSDTIENMPHQLQS